MQHLEFYSSLISSQERKRQSIFLVMRQSRLMPNGNTLVKTTQPHQTMLYVQTFLQTVAIALSYFVLTQMYDFNVRCF